MTKEEANICFSLITNSNNKEVDLTCGKQQTTMYRFQENWYRFMVDFSNEDNNQGVEQFKTDQDAREHFCSLIENGWTITLRQI